MEHARCCYYSTLKDFLRLRDSSSSWVQDMKESFQKNLPELPLEESQINAWEDCFKILQEELPKVEEHYPNLSIVFEYTLPYESGRRPDVLLLCQEHIIVLEFKQYKTILNDDIDQVSAYARDLREYHFESREIDITPVLVRTGAESGIIEKRNVFIVGKGDLFTVVNTILAGKQTTPIDTVKWMESKYEPLPTIVEAAKKIFLDEPLPNIRRVNSTCIPNTLEALKDLASTAEKEKKHVLAFVTGVPGAGKTYLGLQFVYNVCNTTANAWFLSGNNALIAVLQDALKNTAFIKNIHNVIKEHIHNPNVAMERNVIVFDEGQRAWDSKQMEGKKEGKRSEPDLLVEICDQKTDWCVLLILVGEGQEIHNGEHGGLKQWSDALRSTSNPWMVVGPEKAKENFGDDINMEVNKVFDLDLSLRTHTAENFSKFINLLMDSQIDDAKEMFSTIPSSDFYMYFTRSKEKAEQYCQNMYGAQLDKRYGWMVSSKAKARGPLGPYNLYQEYNRKPNVAKWFNTENTSSGAEYRLNNVLTEFDCQGLEVDMPLIGWSDDVVWNPSKNAWQVKIWDADSRKYKQYFWNGEIVTQSDNHSASKEKMDKVLDRINCYRVLLTRGRDGFIVFIPPELDSVAELMKYIGIESLDTE